MKKTLTYLFVTPLLFFYCELSAQSNLTVNLDNLKTNTGFVEIGLFNKEKGFLKENQHFRKKRVKVTKKQISYTFTDIPDGDYAIAVYHDENANGITDKNFWGIPQERYGFSNNFRPKISAPTFEQVKFSVNGNENIDISLI
ncbi:DUF2141 domain-containing protein [Capnocytophaga felis]|uniref:DUF2141 domain-containing protein n=1 Tax=Capnocytophaga felis TaxID=2267611 RepID=A0A5M4B652_9FLAO|nr:DUF2141 domain-containing protein [Capnocytophaga felis]GET45059.1 hypothetical protein RCZ01_03610 [Capnocytophaga felis]GET47777.1 hypothetical protein RCZ02_06080 [Capnocytophaga felis]